MLYEDRSLRLWLMVIPFWVIHMFGSHSLFTDEHFPGKKKTRDNTVLDRHVVYDITDARFSPEDKSEVSSSSFLFKDWYYQDAFMRRSGKKETKKVHYFLSENKAYAKDKVSSFSPSCSYCSMLEQGWVI